MTNLYAYPAETSLHVPLHYKSAEMREN